MWAELDILQLWVTPHSLAEASPMLQNRLSYKMLLGFLHIPLVKYLIHLKTLVLHTSFLGQTISSVKVKPRSLMVSC